MTTAEIALLISGFSAGIALLALGWNIYRDIILKPKVKVRLQITEILTPGDPPEERDTRVDFTATNFGPGTIILQGIRAKTKKFLRKTKWMILFNDFADPLSRQFPCKLEIGEKGTFLLPYRKGIFLKNDFTKIGIADSFSRIHWVPKKDIKRVKKAYIKDFGGDSLS